MSNLSRNSLVDTNIEFLGTNLEHHIKEESSKLEIEWNKIDTATPGLTIWIIKNFKVVQLDKELYGTFSEGDSYIILNTYMDKNNLIRYNLHFWLGSKTSQDEMGVAAYKTVELDTFLKDKPVQYREIQWSETDLFKSYFPQGISYKVGGVDSGFKIVKPYKFEDYTPILYKVHEKTIVYTPLDISSINEDDAFILDTGLTIYIYFPNKSTHRERFMAEYFTQNIKTKRQCNVLYINENSDEYEKFISIIKKNTNKNIDSKRLFRISETNGVPSIEQIHGNITLNLFDTNDSYVFDTFSTTYIWVGHHSSYNEITKAWKVAFSLTKISDHLILIKEGNEPEHFLLNLNN